MVGEVVYLLPATYGESRMGQDGQWHLWTSGKIGDMAMIANHEDAQEVRKIAQAYGRDSEQYKDAKKSLASFMVSSTHPTRAGSNTAAVAADHNGIIGIDIDDLTELEAPIIRDKLEGVNGCVMAFVSASGQGVRGLYRVDPVPYTEHTHKQAFAFVKRLVEGVTGRSVDNLSDVKRLSFVSYDPKAYCNPEAEPLRGWDEGDDTEIDYSRPLTGDDPNYRPQVSAAADADRSNALVSWCGRNYVDGIAVDDLVSQAMAYDSTTPRPIQGDKGGAARVERIVRGWVRNKEPIHRAEKSTWRPSVTMPARYEERALGEWVGKQVKADMLGFRFDRATGSWYQALSTHWEEVPTAMVQAVLADKYLPVLIEHAAKKIARTTDSTQKIWKQNLSAVCNKGMFVRQTFGNAVMLELTWEMPTPPAYLIPTLSGVVDVRDMTLVPFNAREHTHKSVCPVKVTQDDLQGNSKVVAEYERGFVSRFASREMYQWTMSLVGRAILGKNHRAYLVLTGQAGCGKSTWTTALHTAFGSLAKVASDQLFYAKGNHNDDLCDLIEYQSRLVFLPENTTNVMLAKAINSLTGSDAQTSRRAHGRGMIAGIPIAMPIISSETPPRLSGTTRGTMERQKVVKFRPLTMDERVPKLIVDAGDPQSDLVRGTFVACVKYAHMVLKRNYQLAPEPAEMVEDSQAAIGLQDPIAAYIVDHAQDLAGKTSGEILEQYLQVWNEDAVKTKLTPTWVGRILSDQGWMQRRGQGGKRAWYPPT